MLCSHLMEPSFKFKCFGLKVFVLGKVNQMLQKISILFGADPIGFRRLNLESYSEASKFLYKRRLNHSQADFFVEKGMCY